MATIRVLLIILLPALLAACVASVPPAPPPPTATTALQPAPTSAPPTPTTQTRAPSARPVADPPARADDEIARMTAAIPDARDQEALVAALRGEYAPEPPRGPRDVAVGDIEEFWVLDPLAAQNVAVQAELRYAGPIVLMYVDTRIAVEQPTLEADARAFEERIYPYTRSIFGAERSPGIDGDARLTVLNTNLRGAGGYFSPADTLPRAANRFSNEREMFVIALNSYPIGSESYLATLAHEYQHMIDFTQKRRRPAWLSEGLATLAEDLNGFAGQGSALGFLADTDLQLTTWAANAAQNGRHYGASRLFLRYMYEQYLGDEGVRRLSAHQDDDIELLTRIAAERRPDIATFADLYADWATANLLNDPSLADGRYAYSLLPERARPQPPPSPAVQAEVHQFGADYIGELQGPLQLTFDGETTAQLMPATPASGRYAWWSNRGDEATSTLTREFDLRGVAQATLTFDTWFEIEPNYDYGFVSVSVDEGQTWEPLAGRTTTNDDPQGQNFGNGITGVSGGGANDARGEWVAEQFDLSAYTGRIVQIRFWMVSDAAVNMPGWLIDNLEIPEIGYRDEVEAGDGGWQARGFVRVTTRLDQEWALRLIRQSAGATSVERLRADEDGRAIFSLAEGERGILLVSGATPFTTEPARYSYTIGYP
jgi:hypothetical protein